MSLLIANGEIVTDQKRVKADVLCEGERITRIGTKLDVPAGTRELDASGKLIFPGFIDPHVHVYLPLKTVTAKDTYETASRAALMGGTTCFFDFVSPERGQRPLDALRAWDEKSGGRSFCDFCYHMAVVDFDEAIERDLLEVMKQGIPSFKVYLAYKESVAIGDSALASFLAFAARTGALPVGHCEDAEEVSRRQHQLIAEGKTEAKWHYDSRPPEIEASGTRRFLEMARAAGSHAYVVHLSCEEALNEVLRIGGIHERVWVETLISFLVLDRTYAEQPGLDGARYIVAPPLREKKNQEVLWRALADGTISTLATDHAPFDLHGQKTLGADNFTKIPNGMPTLEDRIRLLYTHGVLPGRLSLSRFVEVASTAPARIFGLYPQKGTIEEGSDADLVVFDPEAKGSIRAADHQMNVDYNPFEGWEVRGRPQYVTVRGELAVDDGEFTGTQGRGRFVPREPTHQPA